MLHFPETGRRSRRWLVAWALLALVGVIFVLTRGPKVVRNVRAGHGVERVESWSKEIRAAAREFDLDPYLLAAIMFAESSGRVDAVSSANALGLMQLSLGAAGDAARRLDLPAPSRKDLLRDGRLNVRLAARHLVWLFEHEEDDLWRVLVAYNAGRTKLRRWAREAGGFEAWKREREAAGNSQVLAYVKKVIAYRETFRERDEL